MKKQEDEAKGVNTPERAGDNVVNTRETLNVKTRSAAAVLRGVRIIENKTFAI